VCICAVPPAPSNVRVLSRRNHCLVIGWQAPYPPHGTITQYLVKYRRQNMPFSVPSLVVLPPMSPMYNLTGLEPNSVYSVQVLTEIW